MSSRNVRGRPHFCYAKVSNLQQWVQLPNLRWRKQDVGRLQIAMYDTLAVDVVQAIRDMIECMPCERLWYRHRIRVDVLSQVT